ncbi:hypothetical protein [Paenibacillus glacialis]|uniref:2-methylcitrate dehydratase n=1 Tax=Paenibacillus glacialis TaxID=494026 RepID=A0A168DF96_9BACL|nr:hypothetical protein [Paenibacillus glacialis]OAB34144.1 hypothetical protein PGLA_24935 [Paenibacillus glacialis]
MSFINFKGTLKKINLKSAEETEVTISIPAYVLDGQYNTLQSMLEQQVIGGLDSQVVTYKVMKNAMTGKPITRYAINSSGVVTVAKPEGEQLSLDLGLPAERIETKEEAATIDLNIINDFILSGMAPHYDDLNHDFLEITERLNEGDTYLKLAGEEDMGVGIFVMMVDEYRKRVAPLAAKWDEWRKGKVQAEPTAKDDHNTKVENAPGVEDKNGAGDTPAEENPENAESEVKTEPATEDGSDIPDQTHEGDGSSGNKELDFEDPIGLNGEDKYNDGAQSSGNGESNEQDSSGADPAVVVIDKDELEHYILTNRPTFEDIPFDFPSLLKQRKEDGKTWMDISRETGVPSTQISSKYSAYKKRVTQMMKDGGAA